MASFQGIPASPGFAVGPVHLVRRLIVKAQHRSVPAEDLPAEIERLEHALARARDQIQGLVESLSSELGAEEAEILGSQLLILEDALIHDASRDLIVNEAINAESAFSRSVAAVATQFLEIEDEVFRERVNDLRDVEQRVLRAFLPEKLSPIELPAVPSVIAAQNLAPSDTALLGRNNVLGFVMDEGGKTGHVAILARSLGVPAIVGLQGQAKRLLPSENIVIDGTDGLLITEPDAATCDRYDLLARQQVDINEKLSYLRDLPAVTPDGHTVRMMANIELPVEVDAARARGAEGIGLLRTEYLFFQHGDIPREDDQVKVYTEIVRRMEGRPVIFRSLDVGGDKVSEYLGAKREYNPFLGWRGIRFALANRTLFKTQIKAFYRAAAAGSAKIMFPMITGVEELREARAICQEAVAELQAAGVEHDPDVDLGIMIETPSAVLAADLLARECDFFSIGSNDLIQYLLAMDRGNSRVSYLYRPLHPAVLRSILQTVRAGHAAGIWVGLCGEMGSETRLAEVMLGLGLDEISLSGAALPKIKQVIRWTPYAEAQRIVEHLVHLATADEADAWLDDYITQKKLERSDTEVP